MTHQTSILSRLFSWCRRLLPGLRDEHFEFDRELEPAPGPRMRKKSRPPKGSLREWLMENNYRDVAATIEQITNKWRQQGKATRRNWWEVLSGDRHGHPRKIEGIEIPVLKIAQIRQGKTISMDALCRNEDEQLPSRPRSSGNS